MESLIANASKHLRDTKTTGFSTSTLSVLIYTGSFSWFVFLVAADAYALAAWDVRGDVLVPTLATSITLNSLMFLLQTVNTLQYQFKFWAVVSLYWTCQLTCIGIASAWVGYAIVYPEVPDTVDENRIARVWTVLARLLAQCLFTSSQLAVMLEYLHRAVEPKPVLVAPQSNNMRRSQSLNRYPRPR